MCLYIWLFLLVSLLAHNCYALEESFSKTEDQYLSGFSDENNLHFKEHIFDEDMEHDWFSLKDERVSEENGVLVDDLKYDDYGDYDLEAIRRWSNKPLSERKYNFMPEDKLQFYEYHNLYRMNTSNEIVPELIDMEFMEWDNVMEWQAIEWVDLCRQFEHGVPKSVNSSYTQNLYFGHSNIPSRSMFLWYGEIEYFDFEGLNCTLKNPTNSYTCGHFTALMWHGSNRLGCGRQLCVPRISSFTVGCHYIPKGNFRGFIPFRVGKACNDCQNFVSGLCWNRMCVNKRQCRDYKLEGCKCNMECLNCGELDVETCQCKCSDGWDWPNCSRPCANKNPHCGKRVKRNRILRSCSDMKTGVAIEHCRQLCGRCEFVDKKKSYALCCAGTVCPNGYTINATDCSCIVECPGILCHYGTTEVESPLRSSLEPPSSALRNRNSVLSLLVLFQYTLIINHVQNFII